MKIVLASSNPGKLLELRALLKPAGLQVVSQDALGVEPPEETGVTFVENALIKARAACAATGLPALADDSGVVVDALGGAPGVRSARYAGEGASDADNLARLLEALAGVDPPERGAAFVCAIVYLRHAQDPCPIVCEGVWRGRILDAPRGDGGFATIRCSSSRRSAGPRRSSRARRRTRSATGGRRSRNCSIGSPDKDRGRTLRYRHRAVARLLLLLLPNSQEAGEAGHVVAGLAEVLVGHGCAQRRRVPALFVRKSGAETESSPVGHLHQ